MSNPVCVDCGVEMRIHKTGSPVVFHDSVDAPYYNSDADIYKCPKCLRKIAVGFGSKFFDQASLLFAISSSGCVIVRETFIIKVTHEKKTNAEHGVREPRKLEKAVRTLIDGKV